MVCIEHFPDERKDSSDDFFSFLFWNRTLGILGTPEGGRNGFISGVKIHSNFFG